MSTKSLIQNDAEALAEAAIPAALDRFCRSLIIGKLSQLRIGLIELAETSAAVDAREPHFLGDSNAPPELRARVLIHRPRVWSRTLLGGSIGSAESYVEGDWDCDNLTALTRIFVANRDVLRALDSGWGALLSPLNKWVHRMRKNSIQGARSNIQSHYDLGNDFFGLFLDETWTYSCGIFESESDSLFEASIAKLARVCRKLDLKPIDHVVEIGSGWGGFAIYAAKHFGCRVTTTTISERQFDLARARIHAEGLEHKITLMRKDYRELSGQFDKLVSIEMVEAVGLDFLPKFFEKCGSLLKPDGQMLLQAIIIQDQYYEQARKSVDFIQKYIFPGSGIPSISSLIQAASSETDLRLFHQEDITEHYALTLHHWASRLNAGAKELLLRGYPETLHRLWQFYFAYCEGGFRERSIGCVQMLWTKPRAMKSPLLGKL